MFKKEKISKTKESHKIDQRNKYYYTKKHHLLVIIVTAVLFIFVRTDAKINRIPADFVKIQSVINASSNNDTVVVYPGTYYENVILRGKKIVLTSRFYETVDIHSTYPHLFEQPQ